MRLKFGQLTLIPLGILLSLPSCGKKTAENEGFLPKLSELTREEFKTEEEIAADTAGDSLWAAVAANLEIPVIDSSSSSAAITSLGIPSTLITDTTKATAAAAAKVGAVVASAAQQKCTVGATTGPFLTDLTSTIAAGVLSSTGVTIATGGFKIDPATGLPMNLKAQTVATTKIFLMAYKINDDTDFRYAFLSAPQLPASTATGAVTPDTTGGTAGFPVAVYAHASTGGLSYGEIAKVTGDLQLGHIILAPAFPGEKICVSPDAAGVCTDDIGKTSVGTSKPYQNDVTDLLGAYECLRGKLIAGGTFGTPTGGTASVTGYAKVSAVLAASGATAPLPTLAGQPLTYAIGVGRGANVITLAQQRAGAINSVVTSTLTDSATVAAKAALTSAGIYYPEIFSCSLTAGGNYALSIGKNKVYLNYWISGHSDFIPTESQALLDGIPGFKEIHATIAAIRDDATKDEATKATEIANYVKAVDSSFLMSLLHGSVGNWGKLYQAKYKKGVAEYLAGLGQTTAAATAAASAKATLAAAQGASLLLHGTKDIVADFSNTKALSAIGAGVTAAIATEKAATSSTSSLAGLGGVNWLALGISEDGSDNGHVTSVSFATGKSVSKTLSGLTTVADETTYLDKTTSEIIPAWLAAECAGKSIIADAVTP